ncbi:MAG: hypothetical protein ARM1_0354 [Candidatus Micrarchaeota archaeon]|nr:MAG: hypothetical protein ARM1_0354 [Candidatus Micrarchaeota archaeon]
MMGIVTSIDGNKLILSISEQVDLKGLIGHKARYIDNNDKEWLGNVVSLDDEFLIVEMESMPSSIGQGQLVEIEE